MNTQFQLKFLNSLNAKKADQGFTLIELLVVVIIIGVLAAIALPNLLGQVAKGRQAEAKNNLGAINRAQQTYRLEEGLFAPVCSLPVKFYWQYFSDPCNPDPGVDPLPPANTTYMTYSATAKSQYADDILNYAAGVYQLNGTFNSVICEESSLNSNQLAVNATANGCTAGKPVIK